ncbi:MAG: hypothetical protein HY822_19940 [Acidobacteria bacterium]|nr:hypothetical protein [Acidobacteriota bacterium]
MIAPWLVLIFAAPATEWKLEVQQLTFGPKNHFFGYIGHVKNIPWNGNGRYIVALRTGFQDRMPAPSDAAEVVLIDTLRGNRETVVDHTRGWNFQQGTMFYWNPRAPDTQLFFNDRDPKTNHVFTVLFDIAKKKRIREFRCAGTPFGNSGVAQNGGRFLGLNYGRLARLRPVTGYPQAFDWAREEAAPASDGIFLVDVASGASRLLVSYQTLAELVKPRHPDVAGKHLFINHTLWNRGDDRIYFYLRGDFDVPDRRLDIPCTIRPDGTGLTAHTLHIGGHPEWETGSRIIGSVDNRQIVYDVDRQEVVETIGGPEVFPKPGGDVALSPDGNLLVNGYREKDSNYYVVFRRRDGAFARTPGFAHPGRTSGELRVDGSPNWNRTSDQILFPGIAHDAGHTRQLFLIRLR